MHLLIARLTDIFTLYANLTMKCLPSLICPVCHSNGKILYNSVVDCVFGVSGEWIEKCCLNPECGLIWLDPSPDPTEVHKAYKNYYTHTTASAPAVKRFPRLRSLYRALRDAHLSHAHGYTSLSTPILSRLLSLLAFFTPFGRDSFGVEVMFLPAPKKSGTRLLEIGCGDGRSLRLMRSLGWEVEAVEFDAQCVEELARHEIKTHLGDIRSVNLASDTYDAIFMGHVLEHVYDPQAFLRECLRVLKPGGQIVMLTPNSLSWGHRWFGCDWRGLEPPRHIQVFHHRNLRRLVVDTGFQEVAARTTNRGAYYILGASAEIRKSRLERRTFETGRVSRSSPSCLLFQALGRILIMLDPLSGEEILLTACKPKA